MMKSLLVLVLFVLAASPVRGQALLGVADLAALGYGGAQVRVIEADGDPDTIELLATRLDGLFSVAAIRGTSCAGAWFNPRTILPLSPWSVVSVERVQGRDVLLVREMTSSALYAVALTAPTCP